MRCTQNVHFSMTPLARTITSGFSARFSGSGTYQLYDQWLKRRALYGQLFAQNRVPMQRFGTMTFRPSMLW